MSFRARNLETKEKEKIDLKILGQHNVLNCLAALATLDYLGISLRSYKENLLKFQGSQRRFEKKGEAKEIIVIDDYAHHPTAVQATIDTARAVFPNRRIWAVFEPHTFSRTKATLKQLAHSFLSADQVIIPKIYPAREKFKKGGITAQKVVDEIKKYQQNVYYLPTQGEVVEHLLKELRPKDVVIIMAVGVFNQVADLLLSKIENG